VAARASPAIRNAEKELPRTRLNSIEIGKFVLTFVLTSGILGQIIYLSNKIDSG
jgi:hypothetical protein